jgi:hypothetical protein
MKKQIQLSEQELHRIVKNSVNSLINEGLWNNMQNLPNNQLQMQGNQMPSNGWNQQGNQTNAVNTSQQSNTPQENIPQQGAQFDYNVGMQSLNIMQKYSKMLNLMYQKMIKYATQPKLQIRFAQSYANIANQMANDIAKLYGM